MIRYDLLRRRIEHYLRKYDIPYENAQITLERDFATGLDDKIVVTSNYISHRITIEIYQSDEGEDKHD